MLIDVHRNIGNSGPDQRLHQPAVRQLNQFRGIIAAVEIRVALRPDAPHGRHRLAIHHVPFVVLVEPHQRLGCFVHPAVLMVRAHMVPPGLNAAREALDHPHARFGRRLGSYPEEVRPPAWYMAMLSGITLSQPMIPWISLPVSEFS